jgi:hypothetical protein
MSVGEHTSLPDQGKEDKSATYDSSQDNLIIRQSMNSKHTELGLASASRHEKAGDCNSYLH